ncbi:MAG: HEAT repeat domain-containing protein [Gemmataceae bacterium]|nr:HEAT repeat domain-containing protein [Gemmataceae bacterium]
MVALVVTLILALTVPAAWAITPRDPEVRKAIEAGAAFLTSSGATKDRLPGPGGGHGVDLGVQCLVAVALLKTDVDYAEHALVKQAVSGFKASLQNGSITKGYYSVYHLGVGTIMLVMVKDREGAQTAIKLLLSLQREHGGFASDLGWVAGGDTSMTQYAVLAMWEASQAGIPVPAQAWQRVAGWLMNTQQPDGTHRYNPSSLNDTGLVQGSHSMTVAGLGSMYICANHARPRGKAAAAPAPKKRDPADDLPSALKPVSDKKKDAEKAKGGQLAIDMDRLQAAMARGDAWMAKNFDGSFNLSHWQLYYLYGVERYYSFREKWEGSQPEEPEWYTKGARFLLQSQGPNGSWVKDYDPTVATCFAILFLGRATKKSLAVEPEKAAGTLLSGSGLPTDLSNIRVKDGQVVVKPLAGPAGELLEIIEKPDDPKFLEAVEGMREWVVKADDIMLSPHLVRLRKMAKSSSPEARAAAVALIGKSRDLDSVPTLLYALRDEDEGVMRAAWEALRFVSRRFDSFGLSPKFKGETPRERAAAKERAIERWKTWYRSVRPDAELEE